MEDQQVAPGLAPVLALVIRGAPAPERGGPGLVLHVRVVHLAGGLGLTQELLCRGLDDEVGLVGLIAAIVDLELIVGDDREAIDGEDAGPPPVGQAQAAPDRLLDQGPRVGGPERHDSVEVGDVPALLSMLTWMTISVGSSGLSIRRSAWTVSSRSSPRWLECTVMTLSR